ncbi:MAG: lipid A biosynthesis acyltransferase [Oceanococcus sp.]
MLDRLFLFAGRDDYFQVSNPEAQLFDELAKTRTGAILMISHVGSFDILRLAVAQRHDDLRLRVLMDLSQGATLNAVLKSLNPEFLSSIIDTSQCQGTDLILRIREELDAGAVIGIMADRLHHADERALQADFLGLPAAIPAGPWLIASVMKVPVYMGLGLYQGGCRYHLHFEKLFDGTQTVPRKQREALIQERAQHYLQRLQVWVQRYPYNWFNFYDFWTQSADQSQSDATTS